MPDLTPLGDILQTTFDVPTGKLKTSASLVVGDLDIGAVEIKDHDSTGRLDIVTFGEVIASPSSIPISGHDGTNTRVPTVNLNNSATGRGFYVLPVRATAAAPTYTERNIAFLSTDLAGAVRVSGAAGGGIAQLQVRNAADAAWVNVGIGVEGATVLHVPVTIQDASANRAALLSAAPVGTEFGLVVRNIPSGTQPISGTVTTGAFSSTASAPTFATVGVASGVVIALNAARKGLVLTNNSANTESFNFAGGAAVLGSGITLGPGAVYVMDSFTFTTAAINGIASGAGSNCAIQEFT